MPNDKIKHIIFILPHKPKLRSAFVINSNNYDDTHLLNQKKQM